MVKLSIVTATYNRGSLLKRCYESLCMQTNRNFEWIIIDDGSTDDTEEIVSHFCSDFDIKYYKKKNGGKHTALNVSHSLIEGDYVLLLDSDDYLIETAVEKVLAGWEKYKENKMIGIVVFLKGNSINDPFCKARDEDEYQPVDIMRYKRVSLHSNDCCEVIRSDLFKKYRFPEFENEKFISEGALWNRVSFTHKCIYINEVIYIADYLEGGLTQSGRKLRIKNPLGGMYTANLNMNKKNYLERRIKNGLLYTSYGCFAGKKLNEILKMTDSKVLTTMCYPFGVILYMLWKRKYH